MRSLPTLVLGLHPSQDVFVGSVVLRKAQWISDDKIVIYRLAKDRVYHFESEYYDPQGHEEPTGYPKINLELVTKTY